MELKNVFIDAEKSLGNITFAGAGRESQQRINGGRHAVISRTYSLYSDVQRADNVEVIIPGKAGVKHFEYEEPVVLVNPRVEIEGYAINNKGYVNYKIYADDIISVDELEDAGESSDPVKGIMCSTANEIKENDSKRKKIKKK